MSQVRMTAPVPAFVLHRRAYRDSSLILELLTLSRGRIGAVARGARGPKSRWRALVEPFQPLLMTWQGRGELATVTDIEAVGRPLRLPGARLASGFYLNELTMRLLKRDDPLPEVFAAYGQALEGLGSSAPEALSLRLYEKRLLQGLGYGLLLDRSAADGAPLDPDGLYRYEPEHGPVAAVPGGSRVFRGSHLLALHREQLDDQGARDAARRLMHLVLSPHLGGQPLHSRALYRQLRGGAQNANLKEYSHD